MKLEYYAKKKKFIKDMQNLSYEQRRVLTVNGAAQLHGPKPANGKRRKEILALLYGIEQSIRTDPSPIVQCKAEIDYQKIRLRVLEETA